MSTLTKVSLACGVVASILGTLATIYTKQWYWMGIGLSALAMASMRIWTENEINKKN